MTYKKRSLARKKRTLDRSSGVTLQVHEIFYTVQGEGPRAGEPAAFVRLSGCNLTCWFCDTTWDDDNDPYMHVDDILAEIERIIPFHCKLVVITGGEPVRQQLHFLIKCLLANNYTIQVETAGTYWQPCLAQGGVEIIVSPKTPKIKPEFSIYAAAFKYVIRAGYYDLETGIPNHDTQCDGIFTKGTLAPPPPRCPVYLSPCDEGEDHVATSFNTEIVAKIAMKYGYTAGLQLHKYFNVD